MKWAPCVKRFFIVTAIAVVLIALASIFFWEWDGLIYLVWGIFTFVAIYRAVVTRKLDGRL